MWPPWMHCSALLPATDNYTFHLQELYLPESYDAEIAACKSCLWLGRLQAIILLLATENDSRPNNNAHDVRNFRLSQSQHQAPSATAAKVWLMRMLTKTMLHLAIDDSWADDNSLSHDYSINMCEICLSSSIEEHTATSIIHLWSCWVQPSTLLRAADNNACAHHHDDSFNMCHILMPLPHESSLASPELAVWP